VGGPEVPAAARTDPELIRLPRAPRRRIAHLHLRATTLTPHLQIGRHVPAILARNKTDHREAPAYNSAMVPGVILAAGRSSRMGRSKALLQCGRDGESFVRRLGRALSDGGIPHVLIVGRPDDEALREEVAGMAMSARFVENPGADAGQLSSILAGLEAADVHGAGGLLVTPVDAPLVTPATVATLLAVFGATGAPIVRAVYRGRHGHPVVFSRDVFESLRGADPDVGAKAVLRAHALAIVNVDVDDAGVVGDVDTPEDYRALFGREPGGSR